MRTTIDIPDETYKAVKRLAVETNSTVRQVVLDGLNLMVLKSSAPPKRKRLELPLIRSTRTDLLEIDNEKIYDLIDFP